MTTTNKEEVEKINKLLSTEKAKQALLQNLSNNDYCIDFPSYSSKNVYCIVNYLTNTIMINSSKPAMSFSKRKSTLLSRVKPMAIELADSLHKSCAEFNQCSLIDLTVIIEENLKVVPFRKENGTVSVYATTEDLQLIIDKKNFAIKESTRLLKELEYSILTHRASLSKIKSAISNQNLASVVNSPEECQKLLQRIYLEGKEIIAMINEAP